jgi:pimeloyl-ACP methyl ester carboxylesterase
VSQRLITVAGRELTVYDEGDPAGQGRQDRFVPIEHGEWLSHAIPGAESWLFDDEGHLSLLTDQVGEVQQWLLARLAAQP